MGHYKPYGPCVHKFTCPIINGIRDVIDSYFTIPLTGSAMKADSLMPHQSLILCFRGSEFTYIIYRWLVNVCGMYRTARWQYFTGVIYFVYCTKINSSIVCFYSYIPFPEYWGLAIVIFFLLLFVFLVNLKIFFFSHASCRGNQGGRWF